MICAFGPAVAWRPDADPGGAGLGRPGSLRSPPREAAEESGAYQEQDQPEGKPHRRFHVMRRSLISLSLLLPAPLLGAGAPIADDPSRAAAELERAIPLQPDLDNGREVYMLCAVCHEPEGWGTPDGEYPQIAGQHATVIIKQLADIRARNRDNPTMFPFTLLDHLTLQEIADVSAYISRFPMNPDNGLGPGDDLVHGKRLYEENCLDCHGEGGEGIPEENMPLIQGQHYRYLVRQFEWIRSGKRRNADPEMVEQIQSMTARDVAAVMDYTSRLEPPAAQVADSAYRNPDFPDFWRPAPQGPSAPDPPGRSIAEGVGD
jgi:cytochrome c553